MMRFVFHTRMRCLASRSRSPGKPRSSLDCTSSAPSRSFWSAGPLCLTRQGWCVWSQFRRSSSQCNTKHRAVEHTHTPQLAHLTNSCSSHTHHWWWRRHSGPVQKQENSTSTKLYWGTTSFNALLLMLFVKIARLNCDRSTWFTHSQRWNPSVFTSDIYSPARGQVRVEESTQP